MYKPDLEKAEESEIKLAGQESTARTGHGTMDWFKIGKRVRQGCLLSLCLFNLKAEYIVSCDPHSQRV